MALSVGARIGPFEITGPLGAGGMGEVYRAVDANLGRSVAIKVLPESLADDADRLARFEREAHTLAALNHPNIAQVYGFEKGTGLESQRALIMEFVDGPTLADRIAGGPMPLDEVIPIALQIAEALESAHDLGIIHRDLKPANIKVRTDGTVKVLDFGLAKAVAREPASGSMPNSPTITTPAMTQAGVVLGTAAYMSPEQAKGRSVDRRADIWAFGCVLYEMLTSTKAFGGDDISDVLVAIMRDEPHWDRLPPSTPARITALLDSCLQKDAKRRLPHIGVARIELSDPASGEPGMARFEPPNRVLYLRDRVLVSQVFDLTRLELTGEPRLVAGDVLHTLAGRVAVSASQTGVVVYAGEGANELGRAVAGWYDREGREVPQLSGPSNLRSLKLSNDGKLLAFLRGDGGIVGRANELWIYDTVRKVETRLAQDGYIGSPVFSPDGSQLAFAREGPDGSRSIHLLPCPVRAAEPRCGARKAARASPRQTGYRTAVVCSSTETRRR